MPFRTAAVGAATAIDSGTSFPANPDEGDVFYRTDAPNEGFYVCTDPAGPTWTRWEIETHASEHQDGGADEINVGGLSGDLADAQDPKAHAPTHEEGGADEVTPALHSTRHENGGADEVSVAGLSGDLADAQDPKAHGGTHQVGGADSLREVDRVEKATSGVATAGDFTVLWIGNVADGETVHLDQATFVLSDGTAVPTGCDAIIATLDNAGGGTSRVTVLSGDGSTIYDDQTGNPLASWDNTTGGALTVAIGVDNGNWNAGSGADQDVQLSVVGVIL